jgi:flagellin
LSSQIDSIVASTTYFDTALLDGAYDESFVVSADSTVAAISVTLAQDYDAAGLGIAADVTSSTNATTALGEIEAAIELVSSGRANIGALESRFDYAASNIETAQTNLEAAMSVYMDADIAQLSADQTELGVKMDSAIQALSVSNDNLEKLSRLLS